MKAISKYAAGALAAAALGAFGIIAWAQPSEESPGDAPRRPRGDQGPPRPEGRRPAPPPKPPLETALDADDDGEISASEIDNAPAVLKKLDKDGDGKLTPEEYRPPHPPRDRGYDDRGDRDRNGPPPRREGRRRGPPEDRDPPPRRGDRDDRPRPPADE